MGMPNFKCIKSFEPKPANRKANSSLANDFRILDQLNRFSKVLVVSANTRHRPLQMPLQERDGSLNWHSFNGISDFSKRNNILLILSTLTNLIDAANDEQPSIFE